MSNDLFSRVLTGAETIFHNAETEIDADYEKLVKLFPAVAQTVDAEKAALKQQLSNAFAFVDTDLKPHYADAASMVESAADTLLMGHFGPAGVIATPAANAGIELGFRMLRAVLDRAELAAKASLQLPAPTSSAQPTVAGVVSALAAAAEPH